MTDIQQALMVVDAEPSLSGQGVGPLFAWTDEDLQALRQTVAKDCDDSQFKVFILACRRLGLDPFARQIVPIVQSGRMTPQVTIDGFRLISERTGKYAGMLGPFWCGKDGVWRDVWLEDGPPAAAKVGILRRDFSEPTWGVCRFKSYAKGGNWNTMPDVMSAKVAEAMARRITFPHELSGVYTVDEMDQAHEDARQAVAHNGARQVIAAAAANEGSAERATELTPREQRAREFRKLCQRAIAAGIREDDWAGVCEHYAGTADHTRMTPPGKRALVRFIEQIEQESAAKAAAAAANAIEEVMP